MNDKLPSWRRIMPNFHKYPWEELEVKAEPIGIRNFKFIKFKPFEHFPYVTGKTPTIRTVIKVKENETRPLEAHLYLKDSIGDVIQKKEYLSRPDKPAIDIDDKWRLRALSLSSDYILQLKLILPDINSVEFDLVSFKAVAQESITLLIYGAVLTLIGAVIGGLLVHFFGWRVA